MRLPVALIAAACLSAPLPAYAQIETVDPDVAIEDEGATSAASRFADRLGDPETQEKLAETVQALGHILLDLPLAPLADAMADAGVAAADEIPNDATLRQLAPEAEHFPDEIAERLPEMMGTMASMAEGLEAMLPALRDMARKIEDALPRDLAPEA